MRTTFRLLFTLGLTLSTTAALAQDTAPPPRTPQTARPAPKPPTPTGSIHGNVFCSDTHRPARGALVMIMQVPSDSKERTNFNPSMTRTAMDGSYTIPNVAEGEYGVSALLPGYLSPLANLSEDDIDGAEGDITMARRFAAAGTVTVTAHQTVTHDVTIARGATVSGRILYSDGSPAAQVNMLVEDINAKPRKEHKPGEPEIDLSAMFNNMFTHQSNGTDDEGHFRISGLTPGTYRVAAVSASNIDMDGTEGDMALFSSMMTDPAALRVYSGDTLHKNAAKTYELRPGDTVTGVDIVIPLNVFHHVSGVLVAKDGRPINEAVLTLVDTTDETVHFTAKVSPEGVFSFSTVPTGTYKLSTTGAQITEINADVPPEMFSRRAPRHPVAAFGPGDTTLIIKDSDVLDVSLQLTEIPLPKDDSNPAQAPPPPQ